MEQFTNEQIQTFLDTYGKEVPNDCPDWLNDLMSDDHYVIVFNRQAYWMNENMWVDPDHEAIHEYIEEHFESI